MNKKQMFKSINPGTSTEELREISRKHDIDMDQLWKFRESLRRSFNRREYF